MGSNFKVGQISTYDPLFYRVFRAEQHGRVFKIIILNKKIIIRVFKVI